MAITTLSLRPYLQQCGYTDDLIQKDYSYADSSGQGHIVPIACFARQNYDSRTACIAVFDGQKIANDNLQQVLGEYRAFGAPIQLICQNDKLLFQYFKQNEPIQKIVEIHKLGTFFNRHSVDFSPNRIFQAKMLGRIKKEYQLEFVDAGLIPFVEQQEGQYLSKLMERVIHKVSKKIGCFKLTEEKEIGQWLVQAAFWLLAAKILKDKQVRGFKTLKLMDIPALVNKVQNHYGAASALDCSRKIQIKALEAGMEIIEPVASLSNMTIESLAYVYENTLISKATRKTLGTHATPSWLVDYIVWNLMDWIESIPQEERFVIEPACGHAPFLTSVARLLSFIYKGASEAKHKYLKEHLIGIEKDGFAEEIARLSLTLADIPNKNGWNIISGDIYKDKILEEIATKSRILLCNPPFQKFSSEERIFYEKEGRQLHCFNKAAEVLWRTLPYMPIGSVFGVILPRVFLHNERLISLRKYIIENFEIREITLLPENVFTSASHISSLILGRKVQREDDSLTNEVKVRYIRIPKDNLDDFKATYNAETKIISQKVGKKEPVYDFRLSILLNEVWEYCRDFNRLGDIAIVGRGLEYKKVKDSISRTKFKGAVRGFVRFEKTVKVKSGKWKKKDIKLTELPDLYWMDISDDALENPRYGRISGCPQILANYARTSGDNPWRLKALVDQEGMPATNSFLIIRPQNAEWSLETVWALLNSPFANAFAFCHCMERHNLEGIIRNIPLPKCSSSDLQNLKQLVQNYFDFIQARNRFFQLEPGQEEIRKQMLAIDAAIIRLYDLPPKLEKQLLDLFNGYDRKGVDFKFNRYYHKGFESWVPLHEYLSEEYQRSTPSFVNDWVEKNRSREIIKAFETAVEAFEED